MSLVQSCWGCGISKESKYANGWDGELCGDCWESIGGGFPEPDFTNAPFEEDL